MSKVAGGELVVKSLLENGFDTVFGIPGVQLDPVFAALHDARDRIRVLHPRHEQTAALMAFGYAHATGRPAVLLVVPGPGFLNAATGMLVGHCCNTPMLCLVGQSERMFIDSGVGVLHELRDQIGIARSLAKWVCRVEEAEEIEPVLAAAVQALRSGRPRPVYVELPTDIMRMRADSVLSAIPEAPRHPRPDDDRLDALARALAGSRRPLIMAGGGATGARGPVQRLAEMLEAPVGMSENGLGTLDARHRLAFTQVGAHKLWADADLALALGTRLYNPVFQWGWDEDLAIWKVDVDEEELGRLPAPVEGVQGEVGEVAERLCELVPRYLEGRTREDQARLDAARGHTEKELEGLRLPREILSVLREALGEDGDLVCDVTQLNHAFLDMYPVYQPRSYVSSGYQGALGFGLGAAMGMKAGRPERPVICLTGDGGFMYAAQELATAMQFDLPVVVVVLNDGSYKNVENILNRDYGGRACATTLINPDFVKFAESFGVRARRARDPGELRQALHDLMAGPGPALIDYRLEGLPSCFHLRFLPQVRKRVPDNPYSLAHKPEHPEK